MDGHFANIEEPSSSMYLLLGLLGILGLLHGLTKYIHRAVWQRTMTSCHCHLNLCCTAPKHLAVLHGY